MKNTSIPAERAAMISGTVLIPNAVTPRYTKTKTKKVINSIYQQNIRASTEYLSACQLALLLASRNKDLTN